MPRPAGRTSAGQCKRIEFADKNLHSARQIAQTTGRIRNSQQHGRDLRQHSLREDRNVTHASTSRSTRLQLALFAFLTLVGFAGLLQTATPYGVSSAALQNLLTPQQSPAAAGTSKAGSQQQQGKQQRPHSNCVKSGEASLNHQPDCCICRAAKKGIGSTMSCSTSRTIHGRNCTESSKVTAIAGWPPSTRPGRSQMPVVRWSKDSSRTTALSLRSICKRRLGYVGGSEGARKRNPECRLVRIVTENRREVITAYPVQAF